MGRRAFRLLPLTAFTAIVYEVAVGIFRYLTGTSWPEVALKMGIERVAGINGFAMLATMTGTSAGWFYNGPMVNGITWYISVLFLCYIVFYGCCRCGACLHVHERYMFVFMIIIGLSCWCYGLDIPFFNRWSAKGYIPFFVGVMLGMFMNRRNYTVPRGIIKVGLLGLMSSVIYFLSMVYFVKVSRFSDNLWLIFIAFPSLIILFLSDSVKKVFGNRIWSTLGAITFDVYVWHYILILLLRAFDSGLHLNLPVQSRWFMIMYSLLCFLWGMISHFLLEPNLKKWVMVEVK